MSKTQYFVLRRETDKYFVFDRDKKISGPFYKFCEKLDNAKCFSLPAAQSLIKIRDNYAKHKGIIFSKLEIINTLTGMIVEEEE